MDAAKTQKVMLGLVAVLAIGAGTYYFVLRDTGPKRTAKADSVVTQRRTRVVATKKDKVRKARSERKQVKKARSRREREFFDDEPKEKRTRRQKGKKVKKKKIAPAA